ncbi:MAG TPA: wax ester/triacylglycerol synthase family O-acyltransferase [Acidimicrobiia bacterium]
MSTHYYYERLPFLDSSFLALDSDVTHMHVAGVAVFDAKPLMNAGGGADIDSIRAFFASRMHLIPRYRQRLAWVPLERHPVWVDDASFDLDYHIRHTSAPRPGSEAQLRRIASRIVSQKLDRSKPLWELWVIEGLEGDRFAMVTKIHHSMLDGVSGAELMGAAFGLAPSDEIELPQPWRPRPAPTSAQLFGAESGRRARRLVETIKGIRTRPDGSQWDETGRKLRAARASLRSGWLSQASRTPVNGEIGPNRRLAWLRVPLADIKEIKNSLGGTVNDVVLAVVAGAVRSFLVDQRAFPVDRLDYRVMAPVSVRGEDQRLALGNQLAMWLVPMPLAEPDPVARLEAIKEETNNLKRTRQALGASTIIQASSGAPATLVSLAARLAAGARPFNMTVTNVPGPQFPLYLMGSRLEVQYPFVGLWHSHGLSIALFSYAGSLDWGINADWDLLPDVDVFVEAIRGSVRELLEAAEGSSATAH